MLPNFKELFENGNNKQNARVLDAINQSGQPLIYIGCFDSIEEIKQPVNLGVYYIPGKKEDRLYLYYKEFILVESIIKEEEHENENGN